MKLPFIVVFFIFASTVLTRIVLSYHQPYPFKSGEVIDVTTHIISEPNQQGKYLRFYISYYNERIQITTGVFPRYQYNDLVHVTGKVKLIKTKNDTSFATMKFPAIRIVPESNSLYTASNFIRKRAITTFESVLSPTHASLLLGIVFGIKRNLPNALSDDLQRTGLMHVIAASGMNVSMVAGALFFLFGTVINRKIAIVLSIMGVWFYAFIAGMQASIVRATIMGSCALAGQFFGRQYTASYFIIVTGGLILIVEPGLITDIGFQLSFLATSGIIFIKPHLAILMRGKLGTVIGEDVTTTLAAQVTTTPILLTNFGSTNLFSVIVNTFVLWTIPALMILGSLAVLLSFVFQELGAICLYLAMPLLWYFTFAVSLGSKFPLTFQIENVSWLLITGYYLVLFASVSFKYAAGDTGERVSQSAAR